MLSRRGQKMYDFHHRVKPSDMCVLPTERTEKAFSLPQLDQVYFDEALTNQIIKHAMALNDRVSHWLRHNVLLRWYEKLGV